MRLIAAILLLLISTFSKGQKDTGYINFVALASPQGLYLCPQVELSFPINKQWSSDPRVGYAWYLADINYFYIQQGLTYKYKDVYATIYPVWLRRYSKDIGYQTPTSILIGFTTPFGVSVEVWESYWCKSFSTSVQVSWRLKKIKV